MRIPLRAALLAACTTLAAAGSAAAQQPAILAGPDAWMSSNVKYVGSIEQDVGLTTGAKIIANPGNGNPPEMFVTSGKNLTIYDISDPTSPKTIGAMNLSVAWEGEEVPTNGKILAISTDYYSVGSGECVQQLAPDGCVQIYDVHDPAHIKLLGVVPKANHTSECALNCTWLYGSAGSIIDARDPSHPAEVGNWRKVIYGSNNGGDCHHIREIRPGVLITACQPFAVISINAEDGGSPEQPVVLAEGNSPGKRFVHSARWPNNGTDKFVLIGGEKNFTGVCSRNESTFAVYDATAVLSGDDDDFGAATATVAPINGTYTDGHAPAGELGCSVHWFQEHPTFHNGGLVALSEYENGVRFLQVTPQGKINEVGYFVSAASSSSSPKWAPDGKTVYSIDYHRGIDILQYTGQTYETNAQGNIVHHKGRSKATKAGPPAVALRAARRGEADLVRKLRLAGWFPGFCQLISQARK
jgi:hypothetical protein